MTARSIAIRPGSGAPSPATTSGGGPTCSYSARTSASARHVGCRSRIARHASAIGRASLPSPGWWRRPLSDHIEPASPTRRLVEERVVEVGIGRESIGWRAIAEDRPDRRAEHVPEVEVDGAHGPVEVDLLVHEPSRAEEHLERAEAGLEQRQPVAPDERPP